MTLRLALLRAIRINMAASVGVVVDADAFAPSAGLGAVIKALRLTGCAIPGCKRWTKSSVMKNAFSPFLESLDPRLQFSMVVGSRLMLFVSKRCFAVCLVQSLDPNPPQSITSGLQKKRYKKTVQKKLCKNNCESGRCNPGAENPP